MIRTRIGSLALLAAATLMAAFLVAPVGWLLVLAATGTLGTALTDPTVLDALGLSLASTLISLAVIVALGTPLAWLLARSSGRLARLAATAVDLPLVLPPAVAGLALLLLLGRRGPLGALLADAGLGVAFTSAAVVLAQTFVAAPFYVRSVRAGFVNLSHEIRDAARIDGADEWATFLHIGIPLAMPALATGAVLAWTRALGEFGATIFFAGSLPGVTQTLPLAVYSAFQENLEASIAAAAILVVAAAIVLGSLRLFGSQAATEQGA
jgi:molybdate transport system permease protein